MVSYVSPKCFQTFKKLSMDSVNRKDFDRLLGNVVLILNIIVISCQNISPLLSFPLLSPFLLFDVFFFFLKTKPPPKP